MSKDEILKECFEKLYKGIKFDEWYLFKKSKQAQLLSDCYDLIIQKIPTQSDAKKEAKSRLEKNLQPDEILEFESQIENTISEWDNCVKWLRECVGAK